MTTMREMCETIVRADILRLPDGSAPTAEAKLFMVFEWYEAAMNTEPTLEPIDGTYIDDEGEEQWEMWWVIRGPWKVVAESVDPTEGIMIAPRHDDAAD